MLARSVTSRLVWTLMFRTIFSFHPQQRCNIAGWKSLFPGIHLRMLDVPLLWFKVGLHLVQSKPLAMSTSLAFCSPGHFGSWSDPLLVTASCTCWTGRQYHLLLVRDKIGWFGKGGQYYQTAKWPRPRSSFLKQKKVAGSHWPSLHNAEAFLFRSWLGIAPWLPWSSSPKQHPKTPSEPRNWRPTNWYRPRPLPIGTWLLLASGHLSSGRVESGSPDKMESKLNRGTSLKGSSLLGLHPWNLTCPIKNGDLKMACHNPTTIVQGTC